MLKIYRLLSSLIKFLTNITVISVIILLISIFLLAAYSFFSVAGSHLFDFASPLAAGVHALISLASNQEIVMNGDADGSTFAACLVMAVMVWALGKFKSKLDFWFLELRDYSKQYEIKLEDDKEKAEIYETNKQITDYNAIAVLIKLSARDISVDSVYHDKNLTEDADIKKRMKEKEIFKEIYKQLSYIKECQFSKAGNNMLININDFNSADRLLSYLDITMKKIVENLKREKWELTFYIALDAYNDKYPLRASFPNLQGLINLQIPNCMICFESFCDRYYQLGSNVFEAFLKGTYMLPIEKNVWAIVKKR